LNWKISKVNDITANISIDYDRKMGHESWLLVTGDRHVDSKFSNLDLQRKHLAQAVERNAGVIDIGDFFDAMQGRNDRRRSKDDLRPELLGENYLNRLVDFGYELLKPYSKNLVVLAQGNHDTSVQRHNEFDMNSALVSMLRRDGSPVISAGYRGWIVLSFKCGGKSGSTSNRKIYFHHGYGGGGPVTKGVIQTNRRAVYLPDADIVLSGHIHEQWAMTMPRVRLRGNGIEDIENQWHVQVPTYKDEFSNQPGGWHHEKGGPPKPIGAWWIRFYYDGSAIQQQVIAADC
jgi:hypothetical protein